MIAAVLSLSNTLRTRPFRAGLALMGMLLVGTPACDKPADNTNTAEAQKTASKSAESVPEASSESSPQSPSNDAGEPGAPEDPQQGADIPGLAEATDSQQMLLLEAKKAFLTDDLTRAEALFKTLVQSKPVSGPQVSAVMALAQIYIETGRPTEAVKLYDDLSDKVSAMPEIQLVVARAYADLNQHERAIKAYKKLLETKPDYVFAQLEIGKLYAKAGQKDEAGKAFYAYEQKIYKLAARLESAKSSPEERLDVLSVFSLVSDDRATVATVKALGADSAQVRKQAAVVLGQTGAVEASEALQKLTINDPNPTVRMAAQQALKEIKELGLAPGGGSIGPKTVDDKSELPAE